MVEVGQIFRPFYGFVKTFWCLVWTLHSLKGSTHSCMCYMLLVQAGLDTYYRVTFQWWTRVSHGLLNLLDSGAQKTLAPLLYHTLCWQCVILLPALPCHWMGRGVVLKGDFWNLFLSSPSPPGGAVWSLSLGSQLKQDFTQVTVRLCLKAGSITIKKYAKFVHEFSIWGGEAGNTDTFLFPIWRSFRTWLRKGQREATMN